MNLKFIYYCLKLSSVIAFQLSAGTTRYPTASGTTSKESNCPSRPEIKIQIVTPLDHLFPPGAPELDDVLKFTPRAMGLVLKEQSGGLLEPIVAAARLIRKTEELAEVTKMHMKAIMQAACKLKGETATVGELAAIESGEYITKIAKPQENTKSTAAANQSSSSPGTTASRLVSSTKTRCQPTTFSWFALDFSSTIAAEL